MSVKTVLHVGGLHWATSESGIEKALKRRPGVAAVTANAVAQTATVEYDPDRTSIDELAGWVRQCGFHCAGES
ncbi:MAG: heavy-metal-associated domain-containing protein, partial [Intrasporangium sp.]|uniref:heavy-metal-associated domain-containing protein n=1 Tax=Intrasporangium sp. TaxID=1925024 RepID=UPI0026498695